MEALILWCRSPTAGGLPPSSRALRPTWNKEKGIFRSNSVHSTGCSTNSRVPDWPSRRRRGSAGRCAGRRQNNPPSDPNRLLADCNPDYGAHASPPILPDRGERWRTPHRTRHLRGAHALNRQVQRCKPWTSGLPASVCRRAVRVSCRLGPSVRASEVFPSRVRATTPKRPVNEPVRGRYAREGARADIESHNRIGCILTSSCQSSASDGLTARRLVVLHACPTRPNPLTS